MRCICLTSATPDFTGANKMGYYFARSFLEAGWRVVAVCGPRPAPDQPSLIDRLRSIDVLVVEMDGFRNLLSRALIRRVTRFLREQGVDVVVSVVQMDVKIAAWAARRAGIHVVVSAQNMTTFAGNWLIRKLKHFGYGYTLRTCASLVACPSRLVQQEVVDEFGVDPGCTTILPNAADVLGFPTFTAEQIRQTRAELGVADDDLLLANVGRLDEQKGQVFLLRAIGEADFGSVKHKLALVGDVTASEAQAGQQYAEQLRRIVAEEHLAQDVLFLGWRDDVPRILAAADIYVHSALWEGSPLAVVEAMAAALPIIATDSSGVHEDFVNGTHGYIVPKGHVRALADAMEALVGLDRQARQHMGQMARALAEEHHDARVTGRRLVELVENVL